LKNALFPALLNALAEREIPYVLLRDHPEAPAIRDLDLLIDRARLAEFLRLADRHGFQLLKSGRLNPGKKVLLHWNGSGPNVIDLHERLIYRGYEYLDASLVLRRRQRAAGYFHLSLEDELLTLLLHNVLGKAEIQAKHRDRLFTLLSSRLDESYIAEHLQRYGLAELIAEARREFATLTRDLTRVEKYRREILAKLRRHPKMNAVRQARIRLNARLEKWLGKKRGALIAFIGPDGCGKSSITEALREEFRRATLATDVVYLGPWGQHKLPLHDIMRKLNIKPYSPKEKNGKASALQLSAVRRFVHFCKGTVFYLLLAVELWFRYCALALPKLRRGRIVLADRYIYDLMIGYKNRPLHSHKRLRAWLCRHYPKPDLAILLDATPEVIYGRKPQFDLSQLDYIRRSYHELRAKFDLQTLDTSVSVETTREDFKQRFFAKVLKTLKP
jgi:thymidylate kinase